MSEARQHRFEIDIDEIERQLRRSVESSPPPKADPLAELARIVGQDDPFRGILGGPTAGGAREPAASASMPGRDDDTFFRDERGVNSDVYDPAAAAYGSPDAAFEQDEFQPLQPRRSRKRLAAVLATLGVGVVAVGGGLAYRNSGGFTTTNGAPPIISADRTPLKVPPENPGGMEVPNQNRQIYERGATDGQSRIVDSREQPVDVREAVRGLPANGAAGSTEGGSAGGRVNGSSGTQPRPSAVANALGEPRRVRTVAVRPDGTVFAPTEAPTAPDPQPSLLPGRSFPPPVPVATVSVPVGQSPAASPQASPTSTTSETNGGTPVGPAVTTLPPQRPRSDARVAAVAPAPSAPPQPRPATTGSARPAPASTASTTGGFAVQIAVRPSETEARSASSQLQTRYASELGGRTASIAQAEVNGKSVYRVRVGGLSRDDATALCNRLKSSGGQCFVASN